MQAFTSRRILFLTGTRADFGKLKPLINRLHADSRFDVHVFVTGMHMLSRYGFTCEEVKLSNYKNIHCFVNQNSSDAMDQILAKTITGLSDYVRESRPDLLIVHGDRIEALAGATVGALNNILTGHIEGGEVSGTIDEMIRHAVTKLSHIHFVANSTAARRLTQLGEREESIHIIGSPDIDAINSKGRPTIQEVRLRYGIEFEKYGILIFHPVTSEIDDLSRQADVVVNQAIASKLNFVVIYPNNDRGSELIFDTYKRLKKHNNFRLFPSMRFEYFLSLLEHADFIFGNSSAGVREAPHFGVPSINLGTRQKNRVSCETVVDVALNDSAVSQALSSIDKISRKRVVLFGDGDSAEQFQSIIAAAKFWKIPIQKYFVDRELMLDDKSRGTAV